MLHHHLRLNKHQESLTCNITRTVQFSHSEIMKIKSQSVDLTAHFKNKTKHYLSKNTIKCDFDSMWLTDEAGMQIIIRSTVIAQHTVMSEKTEVLSLINSSTAIKTATRRQRPSH